MKKVSLFLVVVLVSLSMNNLYGQSENSENTIVFKFKNQETISQNFVDRVNQKQIDFTIVGLSNLAEADVLKEKISSYRGVINFSIGQKDQNNEWPAKITLYEFADHWMYYKFLFLRNGIEDVEFNNQQIKSEKLSELK